MEVLLHEKQIYEYEDTIRKFKEQNEGRNLLTNSELTQLEKKLERLKQKVYSQLTAWERVTICRHPSRPRSIDYTKNICEKFVELKGDRLFGDDHAVIGGLAVIGGVKFLVIGQEKGCDTESRMHRNFGMLHPEGFRKAMRLMRLAEKFKLPVVSLLDTPGAYAGLTAEERGQGWAIAENLRDMALLTTPIIVVVIGEGASGGALGMGVGDAISMLQHSYYSVITPEGCASIIWKDVSKKAIAAEALKLNAESLLQNGLIDEIIKEPLGGAHHNPAMVYQNVKNYILEQWNLLKEVPPNTLVEQRYMKFRKMGKFLVNGVANS